MLEVTEIDTDQYTFTDTTVIRADGSGEDMTVAHYLHGRCHLFALALKGYFGDHAQINSIIEYQSSDDSQSPTACLVHSYVTLGSGQMVDARGAITPFELEQFPIESVDSETIPMSAEDALALATSTQWGEPQNDEIQRLVAFIGQNKDVYTLTLSDAVDSAASLELKERLSSQYRLT